MSKKFFYVVVFLLFGLVGCEKTELVNRTLEKPIIEENSAENEKGSGMQEDNFKSHGCLGCNIPTDVITAIGNPTFGVTTSTIHGQILIDCDYIFNLTSWTVLEGTRKVITTGSGEFWDAPVESGKDHKLVVKGENAVGHTVTIEFHFRIDITFVYGGDVQYDLHTIGSTSEHTCDNLQNIVNYVNGSGTSTTYAAWIP